MTSRSRVLRVFASGAVASLVVAAGSTASVQAVGPVPDTRAGTLVGWGIGIAPGDAYLLPQRLRSTAFSKIVAGAGFSVALTAAGQVVVLGKGYAHDVSMEQVPASVTAATVVDVAVGGFSAAAVTAAGTVEVWGLRSDLPDAADVPAGLTGVTSVAVGQSSAAGVTAEGAVVAWGSDRFGETRVPADLTGVASLAAGDTHYYALRADGTVAAWGSNHHGETTLPAGLARPGNVKAVAARSAGGLALLADGSVVSWGLSAGVPNVLNGVPDALDGKQVVAISALSNNNMALADDGTITVWGLGIEQGAALGMEQLKEIPSELSGASIAGIAMGDEHAVVLVTEVLELSRPTIAESPRIGRTLTGTPATFSGAPTTVVNQWYAGGAPIPGATETTLALTAPHGGTRIAFVSTATTAGGGAVISTSDLTAPVEDEFAPSATLLSAAPSTYGTPGRVAVTLTNGLARPSTGTLRLTGAGAAQAVVVAGGTATFNLGKALIPGRYTLTATYSGNAEVAGSRGTVGLTVGRGKGKVPVFKVHKMPTSKDKGKAKLVVASHAGLAAATGRAMVTLKRGKATTKMRVILSGGKKSISLPKLKRGTWQVQVSYNGDRNYVAQKSRTYQLKVKE